MHDTQVTAHARRSEDSPGELILSGYVDSKDSTFRTSGLAANAFTGWAILPTHLFK